MLKKTAELTSSRGILMTGSKFRALRSPAEYYETLKKQVASSASSITMSALYLGHGKLESDLIHEIEKALSDPKRPNLKVTVILDHSRALRGDVNSATLCSSIIKAHPDRFSLLLYQVPQLRSSLWSKYLPGQLREVLGVYHCKFNVFDDCAILTGANLSNDYFTDRQDRYLQIMGSNPSDGVVEYLESFSSVINNHCHRVTQDGLVAPTAPLESLSVELMKLNKPLLGGAGGSQELRGSVMFPVIQHSMIDIHQERSALIGLIDATATEQLVSEQRDKQPAQIKIATPYTSFKASLMQALIRAGSGHSSHSSEGVRGAVVSIINPSAQAHGFAGATGVKSLVPKLHQCAFEQAIEDNSDVIHSSCSSSSVGSSNSLISFIQWLFSCIVSKITQYLKPKEVSEKVLPTIYEFSRGKWSFHTKGMWFYPPQSNSATVLPKITYIGSSNFGARSWTRDFELGFILASEDQAVREVMHSEYINIEQHCRLDKNNSDTSDGKPSEAFKLTDSERIWLPAVTRLVKSFL